MSILAGVAVASSLISAYGQSKAASAQARAAKAMARAKRQQAIALMEKAEINAGRMRLGGVRLVKEQQAAFASGGVALGSGSTLAVMNDSINKTEQGIQDMMTDAKSKAAALRAGANVDTKLASNIREASQYQVAGTLLSGAASAYKSSGS